jgi:hypothetical protein
MRCRVVGGAPVGTRRVTTQGRAWLNLGSLLPIPVAALALLWMARQLRRAGVAKGVG